MKQKSLTEKDLERLGFTCVKNEAYINGNQWLLQITDDCVDKEAGEIINRDGTWFDAIGTYNFEKTGEMAVNILCRGNYVCRTATTEEELKLLFLAMTSNELK